MNKVFVVAAREYRAAVRTKAFLVSLLLMPLLMSGGVAVQLVAKKLEDVTEKRFAVIDRTPGQALFPVLEAAVARRNETDLLDPETGKQDKPAFRVERIEPSADTEEAKQQQRYELSQRVHGGEFFGILEIGSEVLSYTPSLPAAAGMEAPKDTSDRITLRYQSNNPVYGGFYRWAEKVLNAAVHARRALEAGLPQNKLLAVLQPVPMLPKGLSKRDPETGAITDPPTENQAAHYLVPAGLVGLMFVMIMVGATPLMQGVIEEKSQRIAEVLLGSVPPFELMLGKLLGMVAVSLTILAVYLGGTYWAVHRYGYAEYLPAGLIAWFILFQTLAVLMYGSVFIAVGAACTDAKETQSLIMPVMIVACFPFFFLAPIVERPNSALAVGLSLFPPSTPMLMIVRQAVPPGIPWWQPPLGILVVLLATAGCVYAAGRIFRVGILMQGKGARFADLVRWVVQG